MSIVNQPDILPGAFAAEGDKNTIPANNDGTSGLASIAKGFPPITQQPLASGGLPPQRADFNGIFNMFSEFLLYIQSGGVFNYNNSLDYKPPAVVWGNNNLYKCVAQNGPNTSAGVQPVTNTSYWQPLVPVSSVSASNNIITVNDEAGEPTQYTIDTLASAPGASDNSNKIPTTAWVQTWAKNFINALDDNLEVQWSGSTFTVPALGITGLMAQNGYISLGKLFGGLILQWGLKSFTTTSIQINLPISFVSSGFSAVVSDAGSGAVSLGININNNQISVFQRNNNNTSFRYIAIGV